MKYNGGTATDYGYTKICVVCNKRFGRAVTGARELIISRCEGHEDKDKERPSNQRAKTKIVEINKLMARASNG